MPEAERPGEAGMPGPLVSVIVPLYNHAAYVEACLDSIAEETYPRLELVVLDDGSRDESFQRAQDWVGRHGGRFERVVLETQANAGICTTFNRLIARCQGSFIALVASDDRLAPGGVQARLEALQAHPAWLGVIGDVEGIDAGGVVTHRSVIEDYHAGRKAVLLQPDGIGPELVLRWCVPGASLMLRKEAMDPGLGVGPFAEDLFFEDREFYLRLIARSAVGFVDARVGQYRILPTSTSHDPTRRVRMVRDYITSQARHVGRMPFPLGLFLRLDNLRHQADLARLQGLRGIGFLGIKLRARWARTVQKLIHAWHNRRAARWLAAAAQRAEAEGPVRPSR